MGQSNRSKPLMRPLTPGRSEELNQAFGRVSEEATKSTTYFHTWWSLCNRALPTYASAMTEPDYVGFFHACRAGFLTLTFVSLAKLLDSDERAVGLRRLREILSGNGFSAEADLIRTSLRPHHELARRILAIRNRAVSHNEDRVTRDEVFVAYGVTPDEIRDFVEDIRNTLNRVGDEIGWATEIPSGERQESATMAMLRRLSGTLTPAE